ncbi:MAG TPA: DUF3857 domain-containing protein [Bacteroidota bacterium]|nr:DUF3857 domain-containing protein [Bacteroidota bacterium]
MGNRLMAFVLVMQWVFLTMLSASPGLQGGGVPESVYLASAIPKELTVDAHAVIRHEEFSLEVFSVKRAEFRVRRIVTVLKPEGRGFTELFLPYDRFQSIAEMEGVLYDGEGKKLRRLEESDIEDYPATSEYSLYDDNRVKTAAMYHGAVPYTVDYSYTLRYDGYLGWPAWYPHEEHASVERSVFTVTLPEGMNLRFWTKGIGEPQASSDGDRRAYTWEARSMLPFEEEPLSSPEADRPVRVVIAPGKFDIDGHPGDLTSWKAFGQWFGELAGGKQELPAEALGEVAGLLKGAADRRDTVRVLYEYLQSHTRYVSIQLGIGGWQPFDARYVHQRRYGDCKALANYMKALLESAGVSSRFALISSGRLALNELRDFPSQQFNHVVLCVPLGPDSIWLECTSQESPFDHLGSDNENRFALLIQPDGGYPVPTPVSEAGENTQVRNTKVTLDRSGNAVASVTTSYSGNQQDYVRGALLNATPAERDQWLRENVDLPAFSLRSADYSGIRPRVSEVALRFDIEIPRYASAPGKRLVFSPNLMERRSYVPKSLEKRKSPIRFSYRYADVDTVRFSYPPGYVVEAYAKPVELRTDFGHYRSEVTAPDDSTLLFTRRMELSALELPPERYDEYRGFVDKIVLADKAVASIVKKP